MNKKFIYFCIFTILMVGLTACAGGFQLSLPIGKAEAEEAIQESPTPNEMEEETEPLALEAPDLAGLQAAYIEIYQEVLPSVVSIEVSTAVTQSLPSMPDIPFDFGFPRQGEEDDEEDENNEEPEYQQSGEGSGFVWDRDGHIVTNNHVVAGADHIRVRFSDGTSTLAEVIGSDSNSDLAVLKADVAAELLQPIQLADSTQVKVGQIAIAIGNPFRQSGSMTAGIVSGLGRSLALESDLLSQVSYTIPDVIQTDTAINPGNSGGVLVDIAGKLIGVTTAIESPVRANSGVGYVIPSIIVQKIVPFLIKDGSYQQPYIGITGRDLTPELAEAMGLDDSQRGALVIDVVPGTPAEEAGFKGSDRTTRVDGQEIRVGGDIIVKVNDQAIDDFEDVTAYLARYSNVGDKLIINFLRNGTENELNLTLAARPGTGTQDDSEPEEAADKAWLGITGIDMNAAIAKAMGLRITTSGVLIQQITTGSPADMAGLRGSYKPFELDGEQVLIGGDIVTAVDGKEVDGIDELAQLLNAYQPKDEVTLSILRDGEKDSIRVTLAKR